MQKQPVPVQIYFAFDAAKERAAVTDKLKENEPFKSLLAGDLKAVAAQGLKGLAEILKLTHTGMTTIEYEDSVRGWLHNARHPKLGSPYTGSSISRCSKCLTTCAVTDFKLSSGCWPI